MNNYRFEPKSSLIIVVGLRNATAIYQAIFTNGQGVYYPLTWFINPGFNKDDVSGTRANDMSVIITDSPIRMTRYHSQPICMPPSGITNTVNEYAMLSGWGATSSLEPAEAKFLPMNWMQILPTFNNETDKSGDLIMAKIVPTPGETMPCTVSNAS